MSRKNKTSPRLREMSTNLALVYCTNLTKCEMEDLSIGEVLDLLKLAFRPYILNGFTDAGITIPPKFSEVWERCKAIIDREAGK